PTRAELDVVAKIPNLVDAPVAGAGDFQNVDVFATRDAAARVTLVAGRRRGALDAVQSLGQNPSRTCFADAARSREKIGVGHSVALQGIHQSPRHRLLTNNVLKLLRTIAPGQDRVVFRTGGRWDFLNCRSWLPLCHGRLSFLGCLAISEIQPRSESEPATSSGFDHSSFGFSNLGFRISFAIGARGRR